MSSVDITIRDETIKLGQFIKLANLVETGGEAKQAIAEGRVLVNGEVDTRRGRTLREGDTVQVGPNSATVRTGEEDYFDEATANDDFDPEKWRNVQIDPITFD
ncbi:MAG: RNA-binding S4 domain-containing protein [Corynebacterium sp.]|nr:RNA-binding S4 domain-containing protein [Corynebacterium sp.]